MDKQEKKEGKKKTKEEYEIDNTIEWMMADLENCFARNIKNHQCSALKVNYCSNKNMKHCKFYKPATQAIEDMKETAKESAKTYEEHPEYKLIADDALKIAQANQRGEDVKKLTLKDILDFQRKEKKKRKKEQKSKKSTTHG